MGVIDPEIRNASEYISMISSEGDHTSILTPSRSLAGVLPAACPSSAAEVVDTFDFLGGMMSSQERAID